MNGESEINRKYFHLSRGVKTFDFCSKQEYIIATGMDKCIWIFNVNQLTMGYLPTCEGKPSLIIATMEGVEQVRIKCKSVEVENEINGQMVTSKVSKKKIKIIATSPGGRLAAVVHCKGEINIWNLEKFIIRTQIKTDEVKQVKFSFDGRRLYTLYENSNYYCVWNTNSGNMMYRVGLNQRYVRFSTHTRP
ncbi:MAG: hypothetical protein MHPSP_001670, partial [Paramarteilia canceri]